MSNHELANKAEIAAETAKAAVAKGDSETAWAAVSEACDAAEATGFAIGDPDSERAWVACSVASSAACVAFLGYDPAG